MANSMTSLNDLFKQVYTDKLQKLFTSELGYISSSHHIKVIIALSKTKIPITEENIQLVKNAMICFRYGNMKEIEYDRTIKQINKRLFK